MQLREAGFSPYQTYVPSFQYPRVQLRERRACANPPGTIVFQYPRVQLRVFEGYEQIFFDQAFQYPRVQLREAPLRSAKGLKRYFNTRGCN